MALSAYCRRILHYIASRNFLLLLGSIVSTLDAWAFLFLHFGCLGFPLLSWAGLRLQFTITAFHSCNSILIVTDLPISRLPAEFSSLQSLETDSRNTIIAHWVVVADRTMTLSISPTRANVFRDLCLSLNVDGMHHCAHYYVCTIVYIGVNCQLLTVTV